VDQSAFSSVAYHVLALPADEARRSIAMEKSGSAKHILPHFSSDENDKAIRFAVLPIRVPGQFLFIVENPFIPIDSKGK
jgi:hypothetical protein